MTISTLSVTRIGDNATMSVKQSAMEKQHVVHARNNVRVLAYNLSKELKNNRILKDAILQTIGFVESTGGCEESIRMLRKALTEVQS